MMPKLVPRKWPPKRTTSFWGRGGTPRRWAWTLRGKTALFGPWRILFWTSLPRSSQLLAVMLSKYLEFYLHLLRCFPLCHHEGVGGEPYDVHPVRHGRFVAPRRMYNSTPVVLYGWLILVERHGALALRRDLSRSPCILRMPSFWINRIV